MKITWEVDEATTVEARLGAFGKQVISVNGREVFKKTFGGRGDKPFQLDDGRRAVVSVIPQMLGAPELRLSVEGRAYAPLGKAPLSCPSCGAKVRSFDRFCDGCGKALPSPEIQQHEKHVRDATNALFWLAGMFAVFGAIMFFVSRSQAEDALTNLAGMAPTELLEVEGESYSVADLRDQISFEPWNLAITNGVLAATMIALGFWGRRAPLPAILVASAVYAMVQIMNAIIDPKTIAQGLIVKIIVIGLLVKGIKAALALRAAKAATAAA